jgi:transposase
MAIKSKYCYRSRISDAKFRDLVRFFSLDIEAKKTAVLIRLNRNTVNRYYQLIRRRIANYCVENFMPSPQNGAASIAGPESGLIFNGGPKYFGICMTDGKVYTEILAEEHEPGAQILAGCSNGSKGCLIDRDHWDRYVGVVDICAGRHFRVSRGDAKCSQQPNGFFKVSELFWGFAKTRLMKFNGLCKSTLYLHLKECEFRFNHRNEDLYCLLLKIIRANPLKLNNS